MPTPVSPEKFSGLRPPLHVTAGVNAGMLRFSFWASFSKSQLM